MRQRINAELTKDGVLFAGADDIKRALLRIDAIQPDSVEKVPVPPKPKTAAKPGWGLVLLCSIFGVALPLITLGVEVFTGMCAEFFDPIPTPLHVAAIALVGVANLLALRGLFAGPVQESDYRWLAHLNAAVAGIAVFYSLWFAFLTPFALVAVIFFGIGLLPLSPLLSLIVALVLRHRLQRKANILGLALPGIWLAFSIGFGGLVALELPGLLQAWAVKAIDSENAVVQDRALWVLRNAVSETQILKGCYNRLDGERDTVHAWLFGRTTLESRQRGFYRVTGRAFNQLPAPSRGWRFPGRAGTRDTEEWVWDGGQGGDGVGQRLKALYLAQSRLDGTVDGDAAMGYLEWTMVFRNDHEFQQREARCLVQLPSGAVVSRLTLWINGEEREAAFGGRSQVREAYQAVVNRRRDPVLVTAKGPDRVLVQCFPIEPKGREMKIRIGITMPLVLDGEEAARFAMPRVIEQNFSPANNLSHAVWIESSQEISSKQPVYRSATPRSARHALHGELSPLEFNAASSGMMVKRNGSVKECWTPYPLEDGSVITQAYVRQPPPTGSISIVIDGSAALAPIVEDIADELARLPASIPLTLRIAGDAVRLCSAEQPREAADWLRAQKFVGGQDSSAALLNSVSAFGDKGGTVLWICGAQSEAWQNSAFLEQTLARRAGTVRLFALSALPGPNVLLEKLGDSPGLSVLPRTGYFREDLLRALDQFQRGSLIAERKRAPADMKTGTEVSSHLARLWAADEVNRMLAGGQRNREAAVKLAVKMQLVTAMSGAVVLENQQQYDAAGLKPVNPNSVPSVPETGSTLAGLLCALAVLFGLERRVRKAQSIRSRA